MFRSICIALLLNTCLLATGFDVKSSSLNGNLGYTVSPFSHYGFGVSNFATGGMSLAKNDPKSYKSLPLTKSPFTFPIAPPTTTATIGSQTTTSEAPKTIWSSPISGGTPISGLTHDHMEEMWQSLVGELKPKSQSFLPFGNPGNKWVYQSSPRLPFGENKPMWIQSAPLRTVFTSAPSVSIRQAPIIRYSSAEQPRITQYIQTIPNPQPLVRYVLNSPPQFFFMKAPIAISTLPNLQSAFIPLVAPEVAKQPEKAIVTEVKNDENEKLELTTPLSKKEKSDVDIVPEKVPEVVTLKVGTSFNKDPKPSGVKGGSATRISPLRQHFMVEDPITNEIKKVNTGLKI